MKYNHLFFFLIFTSLFNYAQNDISLDLVGEELNKDFGKAYQYYYSNKDSAYFYFDRVKQTSNNNNFIEYQLEALIRESWAANFHNDLSIIKKNIHQLDSIALRNNKEIDTLYLKNYYISAIKYTKGLYEYDLNNYKKALRYFDDLIQTIENNLDYLLDPEVLNLYLSTTTFIGKLYVNEGKYKMAKDFYEKTLRNIKQNPDANIDDSFSKSIGILLADIYQKEGNYEKANANIYKVLDYYINISKNSNRVITSYQRVIENHINLNQIDSATIYLNKMKPFVNEDHPFLYKYYTTRAHLGQAESKYSEAEEDLQTAITILKTKAQPSENNKLVSAYQEMGLLHMHFQQPEKALVQYKLAEKNLEAETTSTLNQTIKFQLLKNKIQATNKLHTYRKSLEATNRAIKVLDELKPSFKNNSDKQFLMDDAFPVFESAMQANYQLYKQTKQDSFINTAFYYAEKSKSVLLMEALLSTKATEFANIPKHIVEQEQILKSRITYLEKRVSKSKNDNDASELFETKKSYRELISTIENDYKAYYDLKYNSEVITLPELQQFLNPNTILVSYFYGNEAIYNITISKDSKTINKIERDDLLETQITSVYNMLNNPKSDLQELNKQSFQLYSKLIAPSLENRSEKNIIIIADGLLNYIPFSGLSINGSTKYLVEEHAISYVNSATLLKQLSENEPINAKVLAFAPSFDGQASHTFLPLPNNMTEVRDILAHFNGRTLSGDKATLENFNLDSPYYGILHFATHAILDDENPEYSYLAFQPDTKNNYLLYVSDIYNLNSNTSLVTLSACESGIGNLKRGEGFISLARGFYFSGAKSIASTLWKINDGSSLKIMDGFYKNLSEGHDKNEALQKAQASFLETNSQNALSHPYYWSSFVISGNMHAIETTPNWISYAAGILGVLAFFAILTLAVLFRKRKKTN